MTVYTQVVNVGSSFEQTFVYTLNDQPVNLTGWGAVFRLRDESDQVVATVRYGDTGDRSLTIDATHGTIDVTMVASATSYLKAGVGTFELEIYELINTGRVFRIIDGATRYRPKGRAMLDNTVCVIRSTTNQVVVETQNVSQYQRIDRGPPGAAGASALNESVPAISEDPAVGSSGMALRLDAQYGLAKSDRHGFMRKEDKAAHDILWNFVVQMPAPSGDTSGIADTAAYQAAVTRASALASVVAAGLTLCIAFGPGKYYLLATSGTVIDMTLKVGFGIIGSGGRCTTLEYVGPRLSGSAFVLMNGAIGCTVEDIEFQGGLIEKFVSASISPSQPNFNTIRKCHFFGPAIASSVRGTSITSVTPGLGAKALTVAAGLSAYLVNGSKAGAFSRGTGEFIWGTVAYNNGTGALTITVANEYDFRGSTAHTDWDIVVPPEGIYLQGTANTVIEQCWFGNLYYITLNNSSFNDRIVENVDSGGSVYGWAHVLTGLSTECKVRGASEPSTYGWSHYAWVGNSIRCEIYHNTGDGGSKGEFVRTLGSQNLKVRGVFWQGVGNPDACVVSDSSEYLDACHNWFSGSYFIDFMNPPTSASINPHAYHLKAFGGITAFFTGGPGSITGNDYRVQNIDGSVWTGKIKCDVAEISFLRNSSGQPVLFIGTTTLVAGVSPAVSTTIAAGSRIFASVATPNTTALTVQYSARPADRVNGSPGSFKISALKADGTVDTANVSAVEFVVINT